MALPKPNRNSLRVSDTALCRLAGLPKAGGLDRSCASGSGSTPLICAGSIATAARPTPARAASRRSGRRRSGLPGAERHPLAGLWLGRPPAVWAQARRAPGNARGRRQVRLVGRFGGRRQHPRQGPGPLRHRAPGRSGHEPTPPTRVGGTGTGGSGGPPDGKAVQEVQRVHGIPADSARRQWSMVLRPGSRTAPKTERKVPGRLCAPSPHLDRPPGCGSARVYATLAARCPARGRGTARGTGVSAASAALPLHLFGRRHEPLRLGRAGWGTCACRLGDDGQIMSKPNLYRD